MFTYLRNNMLPIDKYDLHKYVSHESGNKTTASIQFINLFAFYTKIKTSILLRVGIKKPAQKKNLASSGFFLIFYFLRYLKAFISITLIVIVLLNISFRNSRKNIYILTYPMNNMLPIVNYDLYNKLLTYHRGLSGTQSLVFWLLP